MLINNTEPNHTTFELDGAQYACFDTVRNCLVVNADSMTMGESDINGLVEFGHEMGTHPDRYPNLAIKVDLNQCLDNILAGNILADGTVEPLLIPELTAMKAKLIDAINKINSVLPSLALPK
jgi:hypothetical protein